MMNQPSFVFSVLIILAVLLGPNPTRTEAKPHVIDFRSPNLYPEGIAYDAAAQHFLVGSLRHRTILSVSDAGVVDTLIHDPDLPENVTFLGLAVDSVNNRLLAAVQSMEPLPPFSALAAYDLRTRRRLFLTRFTSPDGARLIANGVAADFKGNAYVTNAAGNFIWKVNAQGEAVVLSNSPLFSAHPVDPDSPYSFCGLNGLAYVSKGYLLVVQSNTGKMFKVDADDGRAWEVLVPELKLADGVAIRRDGVVLVVSMDRLWFLKSHDSWGEAVVYDATELERERFPTSVAVAAEDRVYVIYGHVEEGIMGNSQQREVFTIAEVRSEMESKEDSVWIFVLVGLGLAYFMFWRFQMRQLVGKMNKKTN